MIKNNLVKLRRESNMVIMTLDRPEALNAMNNEMLYEMEDCLNEIEKDKSVRLFVLTGAGEKSFCAGGDIVYMSNLSVLEAKEYAELGHRITGKIENLSCVTVAAVNGYALGGGTEISIACDLRIASPNASFALPEVSLGIFPGFGGTQRLPRLIGKSFAKEMMFTAQRVNAEKALRIGLINEIVPQNELMDYCKKLLEKIEKNSNYATAQCKKTIDNGMELDFSRAVSYEINNFANLFAFPDSKEGTTAFAEKRKANFK